MEAASVIGILGFGLHISHQLYQFYATAAGAADEVTTLCNSAKGLASVLQLVEDTIKNAKNSDALAASVKDSIIGCQVGLDRLGRKVQKIQRLSSEPSVLNLRVRLRYAFQEKTLAKLNGIIHGPLLGHLKLALAALSL